MQNQLISQPTSSVVNEPKSTRSLVLKILSEEARAIQAIPLDNPYDLVTELIYKHCQILNGKVIVSGVGKAGEIGTKIATTLCSTGTPAVFMHPLEGVHGDLGLIQKNDVFIALSNSGKTRELLEIIPLAKKLVNDLPIVSIVGDGQSPLAGLADIILLTGTTNEVCPLGVTPTTSTTVMSVLGDILVCLQMNRTGFSKEEYAKRHHGGYLGSKIRAELP